MLCFNLFGHHPLVASPYFHLPHPVVALMLFPGVNIIILLIVIFPLLILNIIPIPKRVQTRTLIPGLLSL